MDWLARVFARAVIRRVAYALVAMAFAMLGISQARAGAYDGCYSLAASWNGAECPDQGAAWQGAMAYAQAYVSGFNSDPNNIKNKYSVSISNSYEALNPQGSGYNEVKVNVIRETGANVLQAVRRYLKDKTCPKRADYVGAGPTSTASGTVRNGSVSCVEGCEAAWFKNADSTFTAKYSTTGTVCKNKPDCAGLGAGYYWNAFLQVCEPKVPETCPAGQEKGADGMCQEQKCPAGMALQQDGTCKPKDDECPAGQVKGPDGACVPKPDACGAGKAMGGDGTCKNDKDGDGKPDDEDTDDDGEDDKKSFAGGDSCSAPPSCSGDPVMCGMARIQWRIDCNTRRNRNISGGGCAAMPVCTGEKCDAMEYSQLIMQWRSACALEKLNVGGGNQGEQGIKDHMTALKQAEVNGLRALGTDDGHSGVDPASIWAKPADYGSAKISETMFGGGAGTCDLSFTIAGNVVTPSPEFWRICQLIKWLLVASAYVWIAFKVGG